MLSSGGTSAGRDGLGNEGIDGLLRAGYRDEQSPEHDPGEDVAKGTNCGTETTFQPSASEFNTPVIFTSRHKLIISKN